MLAALFSPGKDHVGWLEPNRFIFDTAMLPVGFIAQAQAWLLQTSEWLGPCYDGHLFDKDGRPVAWSVGRPIMDRGVPLPLSRQQRPVTPVRPVRPVMPRRPLAVPATARGWSGLTLQDWLATGAPVIIAQDSEASPETEPLHRPEDTDGKASE